MNETFEIDASRRHNMLHGLDDIAQTLQHEDKISALRSRPQLVAAATEPIADFARQWQIVLQRRSFPRRRSRTLLAIEAPLVSTYCVSSVTRRSRPGWVGKLVLRVASTSLPRDECAWSWFPARSVDCLNVDSWRPVELPVACGRTGSVPVARGRTWPGGHAVFRDAPRSRPDLSW